MTRPTQLRDSAGIAPDFPRDLQGRCAPGTDRSILIEHAHLRRLFVERLLIEICRPP